MVLLKLGNFYSCCKTTNMILTSIFANNYSLFMDIRFMLNTKISSARGINGLHLLLLSVMLITTNLYRPVKHSNCHYNQTKHYMCMCAQARVHTHTHSLTRSTQELHFCCIILQLYWMIMDVTKTKYIKYFLYKSLECWYFKFILHYSGTCIWLYYF